MGKDKGFFHHFQAIDYTELNGSHLPVSMIKKARNSTKVEGSYVCGLNAARNCLSMRDIRTLPTLEHFPYTYIDIFFYVWYMGPRPSPYTDFLKNWFPSGSVGYRYGQDSFSDIEGYIKTQITEGNPVIALGSEGGQAHYFPIVGFGTRPSVWSSALSAVFAVLGKLSDTASITSDVSSSVDVVYVLDNSGNLGYISYSFYEEFVGVAIPTLGGYSCWSV